MISKSRTGQNNQKRRWNKDIWLCRIRGADDPASSPHACVRDQQLAHSQERKTINNSNRTKGQIFGRRAPVVYIWGLGEGGSPTEGREAPTHGQNVRVQGRARRTEARGAQAKTITRFTAPVEKCFHAAFSDGQRKATKPALFLRVPFPQSPTSSVALSSIRDFLFSAGPNMQLSLFTDNVSLVLCGSAPTEQGGI